MENDKTGEVDINPAMAIEKFDSWVDGFVKLLPNIGIAIIVFIIFLIIASVVKRVITKTSSMRGRQNLGENLGGFAKAVVIVMGGLMAVTIVVPSINAGKLISGLGVGSVAIGFAFKDILQNWLAGMLILLRQPFEIGDQIEVGDYIGKVEQIETRATIVRTFDGQRAVIPNSDIYTNAVLVKTGYDKRRSQYDIGIGYGDDVQEAVEIMKREMSEIEGIEQDPAPEAFPWDLAASWVTVRMRWWTDSRRGDVVANRSQVLMRVKRALDEARIDMPYETQVHLFHDQTEDRDGKPGAQREGWPAPKDQDIKPRWAIEQEATQKTKSVNKGRQSAKPNDATQ